MKRLRIHLHISVVGRYYDEEFQEFTRPLLNQMDLSINNWTFAFQENWWTMKTKKKFDVVEMARDAKDKLGEKLSNMTKKQVVDYFKQ